MTDTTGGGSPPVPTLADLKAQLIDAARTLLEIGRDEAETMVAPIAEDLAKALVLGKAELTQELKWQFEAAIEVAHKRSSQAAREKLLGLISSGFAFARFALFGGAL